MGSHIKIRNGSSGIEDTVEETSTPQDLRSKWGLSPDFSFVNGQGERIPEGQEIGKYAKEGEVITPVSEPKFGASIPLPFSPFVIGWDINKVRGQYSILMRRVRDVSISPDYSMILIPIFPIDGRKFNKSQTRLLISFNSNFQWMGGPAFYVDKDIRIHGIKSSHLDEFLTERQMLQANFVKLCWYNPPRSKNIGVVLKDIMNFLERLNK